MGKVYGVGVNDSDELAEKWYGKVDRRVYDALVNCEVSSEG